MKKHTKYWLIIDRLASHKFPFDKHEAKFILNAWENADPYDCDDLSESQKTWLLKLDKKYKEDL